VSLGRSGAPVSFWILACLGDSRSRPQPPAQSESGLFAPPRVQTGLSIQEVGRLVSLPGFLPTHRRGLFNQSALKAGQRLRLIAPWGRSKPLPHFQLRVVGIRIIVSAGRGGPPSHAPFPLAVCRDLLHNIQVNGGPQLHRLVRHRAAPLRSVILPPL
jgi:hypothetical protein